MKNPFLKNFTRTIYSAVIFLLFCGHSFAQDKKQQQNGDPPTPVRLGVMTEKQRLNSKRYNSSSEIPTLISEDRDVLRGTGESFITEDLPIQLPMEIYFQKPICRTETIIVGRVEDKASQLSEDYKAIFTDYEIEVTNIIKNDSVSRIKTGERITVTRSGGVVLLNNRRIEFANASYNRLKIGKNYLLFINYLKDSDSFEPSDTVEGTFEVKDNKIARLRSENAPYFINDDFTLFSKTIDADVKRCVH